MGGAAAESLGHVDGELNERASATGPHQHCPQHNERKHRENDDPHDHAEDAVTLVEPEVLGCLGQIHSGCFENPGPILASVKIYQGKNADD